MPTVSPYHSPGSNVWSLMYSFLKASHVLLLLSNRGFDRCCILRRGIGRGDSGCRRTVTSRRGPKLDQAPVLAITGMQFHDLNETCTARSVRVGQEPISSPVPDG